MFEPNPGEATFHLALSLLSRLPRLILSPKHKENQTPRKPLYKIQNPKESPPHHQNKKPLYEANLRKPTLHPKLIQSNYENPKKGANQHKEAHFPAKPIAMYRKVPELTSKEHPRGSPNLNTKKKVVKSVIRVPYYPPPVQTHYSPPPPRKEMETMVENLHSLLSNHVSSFSGPQLKQEAKTNHGGNPVAQQLTGAPGKHVGSVVLHASPKYPITTDNTELTLGELPSFGRHSNKQKLSSHPREQYKNNPTMKPFSNPTMPSHDKPRHKTPLASSQRQQDPPTPAQPEINSQLLDSFSWVHAPHPIRTKQPSAFLVKTTQTINSKAQILQSPPDEVIRNKAEPFFSKMLLNALKPSSNAVISSGKKEALPAFNNGASPSLNEVRIDPDSFSFRLDKMLRKLSALKSLQSTFDFPAKSSTQSAIMQDGEGSLFRNYDNDVKESSLKDETEYDIGGEDEIDADEKHRPAAAHSEGKEENNIQGKGNSEDKKGDEDDNINPNKEEDDHIDDSVAAVRLEQMIDSLSAFRSNFTQINSL